MVENYNEPPPQISGDQDTERMPQTPLASASPGDGAAAMLDVEGQDTGPSTADAVPSKEKAPFDEMATGLAKLNQSLIDVHGQIADLQRGFDSKIKYDAAKDKQLDALHAELQSHREGLYFNIMRPLLMDLIEMYDDMHSLVRHGHGREGTTDGEARLQRSLASFLDTIEGILDRYGVSVFSDEGGMVSPQRQRAIKVVDTQIAEQDRLIAERLRKGFSYDGRVLRPELVATYRLTRAANAANPEGS